MKKVVKWTTVLALIGGFTYGYMNIAMVMLADRYKIETNAEMEEVDAIIILGARVYSDGDLSLMLADRMRTGIEAYQNGLGSKLLLSGDHGRKEYDEVNNMKKFALSHEVPSEDIFMDHAGFSTYETMYRAKEIFQVKKAIIVTQDYHLKRAVYTARKMGIEAYGIPSDSRVYYRMNYYRFRESLARVKDYLYVNILKPEPTYLGEVIPISGDGKLTQD